MYTPSILDTPLNPTGPVDPQHPGQSLTGDWPFLGGEVEIGIWECTPGTFGGSTGDIDEAMFMVSGRATISHGEGSYDLAPGTLWTTPRDWDHTWHVHQTVRKMYVIDHRPGSPGIPTHLPNAHTVELGTAVPRPTIIAGSPAESSVSLWQHDALDVGVWACTPGEFPFSREGYQEVFCVLSGRATLHIDRGPSFELVPGAMILTPAGTTGRWVVHETIRKAYVTIDDQP
jgi:uncharacterized cupin superfamily protein